MRRRQETTDMLKESMGDALLSLMEEKPLEKIKVNDVCELAMCIRATFYRYYQDIYDLNDQLEDAGNMLYQASKNEKNA